MFVELLEIDEHVVRAGGDAQQLVELHLHGFGVAVLRALDQEHHEERDDRGARVDHELPGIAPVEERAADRPARITTSASANVTGWPEGVRDPLAKRVNQEFDLAGVMAAPREHAGAG